MRASARAFAVIAGVAWVGLGVVASLGLAAVAAALGALAGATTVSAVLLWRLPALVEAYRIGVEVGEHHARQDGGLRVVRGR